MIGVSRLRVELLTVGWCTVPRAALLPVSATGRGAPLRDWFVPARCPALVLLVHHSTQGAILVDTGYAPRFVDATRRWPERAYALTTPMSLPPDQQLSSQLASRGLSPTDIRHVVLTHLHADHVAGVLDFPSATLHARRSAIDAMARFNASLLSRLRGTRSGMLPALLPNDLASRAKLIDDRALPSDETPREFATLIGVTKGEAEPRRAYDLLGDGSMLAIDVPGHAPGMVGIALPALERPLFLVADAVWRTATLAPGMRAGFAERRVASNAAMAAESIRRLQAFVGAQAAHDRRYALISSHDEDAIADYSALDDASNASESRA